MSMLTMTTDIHALQREYASQQRKHRKHQHIILTGSVKDVHVQSSISNNIAEVKNMVDPLTIATISIASDKTVDFLDSITPQVIGDTKCILVQQAKHKAKKHLPQEANTLQSKIEACGRRRAKIPKGRRGRSLSVPAVIMEECASINLTEGVKDVVTECLSNRSEMENGKICGNLSGQPKDSVEIQDKQDISVHTDRDLIADKNEELEQDESIENQISDKCCVNEEADLSSQTNEEKHREKIDEPNETEHGEKADTTNGNKTDEQTNKDVNGSKSVDNTTDTVGEISDDLRKQRLNSNKSHQTRVTARQLPKPFVRSLSSNFESTLQKHDLRVNSEVKASIYHHFYEKKRHLSIDSEYSSNKNDHSADSRILNPFPIQHWNKNRIKAGVKLGLYKDDKLK